MIKQGKGKRLKGKGLELRILVKRFVFLTFALCLLPFALSYAGDPGTSALDFLKLQVGARQAGMGGGSVALADDINAANSNPAGLSMVNRPEAGFLFSQYLQGISYEHLGFSVPTHRGTFGFQATTLDYGSMDSYDANDNRTGSVSGGDMSLAVSYAREVLPGLSFGGNLHYLREKLDFEAATGESIDLGVMYRPEVTKGILSHLRFGMAVDNLGPKIGFIDEKAPLPMDVSAGVGYDALLEALNLYLEGHKPNDDSAYVNLGGEYWFLGMLALRAGYQSGSDIGPGASIGTGVRFGGLQIDYSWMPYGDLGSTQRIGIVYRFGGAETADLRMKAQQAYQRGRYYEALSYLGQLISDDPHDRSAKVLYPASQEKILLIEAK
jgi:hypothetical protein